MSDLPSEVPIFALGTVLFPGGVLPLRIFEPRYLDMIKRCMANGTPFGVCSIKQGREVGQAAGIRDYGTLAHITDFDLLEDGLLGIEARGGERFEVISSEVRLSTPRSGRFSGRNRPTSRKNFTIWVRLQKRYSSTSITMPP